MHQSIDGIKLAKAIFALDANMVVSVQKKCGRLKRWAESDSIKCNQNKHRLLKLHSIKTTNNCSINIVPGFPGSLN